VVRTTENLEKPNARRCLIDSIVRALGQRYAAGVATRRRRRRALVVARPAKLMSRGLAYLYVVRFSPYEVRDDACDDADDNRYRPESDEDGDTDEDGHRANTDGDGHHLHADVHGRAYRNRHDPGAHNHYDFHEPYSRRSSRWSRWSRWSLTQCVGVRRIERAARLGLGAHRRCDCGRAFTCPSVGAWSFTRPDTDLCLTKVKCGPAAGEDAQGPRPEGASLCQRRSPYRSSRIPRACGMSLPEGCGRG